MKTEKEIEIVAKKVAGNQIFMADTIERMNYAFKLPLQISPLPEGTVALYEECEKALPLTLNGYPQFNTCNYLLEGEIEWFQKYFRQYKKIFSDTNS